MSPFECAERTRECFIEAITFPPAVPPHLDIVAKGIGYEMRNLESVLISVPKDGNDGKARVALVCTVLPPRKYKVHSSVHDEGPQPVENILYARILCG